jgi:PucR C-terminal helix-turn-helix domain
MGGTARSRLSWRMNSMASGARSASPPSSGTRPKARASRAYLSALTGRLYSMIGGMLAAQQKPCGWPYRPPMASARQCAPATSVRATAMPAVRLPWAMPHRAAADLHIHKQTLGYRIRKIEQLTGRGLTSTEHLAEWWFALRAYDLLTGRSPAL